MNQQDKEHLIEQWLAGNTTEEELLKSFPQEELDQYKTILQTVDNWEPLGTREESSKLSEILSTPKEAKVVSMNRTPWIISIAASIVLIAVVSILFLGESKTVYTAYDENLEVTLPDESTRVILSPGATLSFSDFDPESREVEIDGRVYFDVTEKGPFTVNYDNGSLSVLGTQFEIVEFDGFFEASCFEGVVKLDYLGAEAQITAGERVTYAEEGLPKIQIKQQQPAWTNGVEKFENADLLKVVRILEARYRVTVESGTVSMERRFTGTVSGDDLDAACGTIFSTLGISYQIQDKVITLSE